MGSGNRGFVKMDGYGECGVRLSKGMLPQNHCTCQEKVEANLEVIGGAGVRGGAGQLETIRQKLGIRDHDQYK